MTPEDERRVVAVPAHLIDGGALAFVGDPSGPTAVVVPLATFRALTLAAAHAVEELPREADRLRVRGAVRAMLAADRGTLGDGEAMRTTRLRRWRR